MISCNGERFVMLLYDYNLCLPENRLPYVGITRTGSKDYFDLPKK
jgi:hypothetical protein